MSYYSDIRMTLSTSLLCIIVCRILQDYFSSALAKAINTYKEKGKKRKKWDGMNRVHCYTAILFHRKVYIWNST